MSIILPESDAIGVIEPRRSPRPEAPERGPASDLRICLNCQKRVPCRCANSLYWTEPRQPATLAYQQPDREKVGRMKRLGNFALWVSASVVVGGAAAMGFHLIVGKAYAIPMFFFATALAFVILRER